MNRKLILAAAFIFTLAAASAQAQYYGGWGGGGGEGCGGGCGGGRANSERDRVTAPPAAAIVRLGGVGVNGRGDTPIDTP